MSMGIPRGIDDPAICWGLALVPAFWGVLTGQNKVQASCTPGLTTNGNRMWKISAEM